jgi:hypothetical protein
MQPELLYPASRIKAVLLFFGSAAFVALGLFLSSRKPIIGWACVAFFSLGIPASLFMLLPGRMYLRLSAHGFEMVSPFSKKLVRWSDVERFYVGAVRGTKPIAIVYRPGYTEQQALRRVSKSMAGMEGAIPNTYAVSREELLKVLNDWHTRYARAGA